MRRGSIVVSVLAGVVAPALAQADDARCLVRGSHVTLHEVSVSPPGTDAFQIGLVDVAATATLPAQCGAPITIEVAGAIELTAKRDNVWMQLSRNVASADGLFVAQAGASVIDACVQGDRVYATAVLFSDDVMEGEHKEPSRFVRNIEVPCDALTLDAVTNDSEDFFMPTGTDGTEHMWELRKGERVMLRNAPNAQARGPMLEYPSCEGGCIHVREIKRNKNWLFVEASGEGAYVRGWVPVAAVKRIPDSMLVGDSYGCTGDHGGGLWGEGGFTNSVERWGTVTAGTLVYAEPAKGEWARFAQATRIKVRITQGSKWAELRHVPGLDGDPQGSPHLNGVVALDALTLDTLPPVLSLP